MEDLRNETSIGDFCRIDKEPCFKRRCDWCVKADIYKRMGSQESSEICRIYAKEVDWLGKKYWIQMEVQ